MELAVEEVIQNKRPVREVASDYDIPKSTLSDRVSGRGSHSGPPKYLFDDEENELEVFLLGCASIGYAKTHEEIIALTQQIMTSRGSTKVVTSGWWDGFCKRHPNVVLRSPSCLSRAWLLATDSDVVNTYCDLLENVFLENDLVHAPFQIYNINETGMPLNPKPPRVICKRGDKNPSVACGSGKSQITVVACVNAGGNCLPPMIIWRGKGRDKSCVSSYDEIPGTLHQLMAGSIKGFLTCGFITYACIILRP